MLAQLTSLLMSKSMIWKQLIPQPSRAIGNMKRGTSVMRQPEMQLICKCKAVVKRGSMLKHWREHHLEEYNKLNKKGGINGRN